MSHPQVESPETPAVAPKAPSVWWLYILKCGDGTLYTGISIDVEARLEAHRTKKAGAKYTKGRGHLSVVYRELVGTKSEASKREMAVKKLTRSEKNALVLSAVSGPARDRLAVRLQTRRSAK